MSQLAGNRPPIQCQKMLEHFKLITVPTMTTRIVNPFFMRVATVIGTAGEIYYCACIVITIVYTHVQNVN